MPDRRPKSPYISRLLASLASLSIIGVIALSSVSLAQTGIPSDVSASLMENAGIAHQARLESETFDEESAVAEQRSSQTSNLPDDDAVEMFPVSTHEEVTGEMKEETEPAPQEQPESATLAQAQEQGEQAAQQQAQAQQQQEQAQQAQQQQQQARQPEPQIHSVASASAPLTVLQQPTSQIVTQRSRTIRIAGEDIPYAYSRATAKAAPESGCAIWKGIELTDDSDYCYFVGHNPGPFHAVMSLQPGDKVSVCDLNKKIRSYTVRYAFIVPQKSTYADIASKIEGHGESVIMQTCCGDNVNVRIVVAY